MHFPALLRVLCVLCVSHSTPSRAQTIDLARFDAKSKLETLDIPASAPNDVDTNFSGAAYNPATKTFLVVDNEPNAGDSAKSRDQGDLYEFDANGKYLRRIDLAGFSDPEGIALIGPDPKRPNYDRYVICEERIGTLAVISIDRTKKDSRAAREDGTVIVPKPNPIDDGNGEPNDGFEGVAYDEKADAFYILKEHGPTRGVYRVQQDGECEPVKIAGLFDGVKGKSEPLGDLADVQFQAGHLFILSEVTNRIVAVRIGKLKGEIVGQFPPLGETFPHKQPEGIAFSDDGKTLWVIGEPRELARYKVGGAGGSSTNATQKRARLELSREVTYFTEPIGPDGLIDYAAALNKQYGEGVTPENNAAVPLLRAIGPGDMNEEDFAALCKRFGIEKLPMEGPYFVSFDETFREQIRAERDEDPQATARRLKTTVGLLGEQLERTEEAWQQAESACWLAPWSEREEPIFAAWLEKNATALRLAREAAARSKYHVPLVEGRGTDSFFNGLPIGYALYMGQALSLRAMHHMGAGRAEEAVHDVSAAAGLAARLSGGPSLIERLIGVTISRNASATAAQIAHYDGWKPAELEKMRDTWRKPPPAAGVAEVLANYERCFALEALNGFVMTGADRDWIRGLGGDDDEARPKPPLSRRIAVAVLIDWNVAYRVVNSHFDLLERMARLPPGKELDEAEAEYADAVERLEGVAKNKPLLWFSLIASDFEVRRKSVGRIMGMMIVAMMTPATGAISQVQEIARVEHGLAEISIALAQYRQEHGKYPDELAALTPKYLPKRPTDLFGDGPLQYSKEKAGFILYSVGPNEKDDAGHNAKDRETLVDEEGIDEESDDITLRVPSPVRRPVKAGET